MRRLRFLAVFYLFLIALMANATIFGTVRGIVHDPQHHPVADITIVLKASASEYVQSAQTDADGQFHFDGVPLGQVQNYRVQSWIRHRTTNDYGAFRLGPGSAHGIATRVAEPVDHRFRGGVSSAGRIRNAHDRR